MLSSVQSFCPSPLDAFYFHLLEPGDGPTQHGWAAGDPTAPEEALNSAGVLPWIHVRHHLQIQGYAGGPGDDMWACLQNNRGEAGRMEPNICGLGATEGQPQGLWALMATSTLADPGAYRQAISTS